MHTDLNVLHLGDIQHYAHLPVDEAEWDYPEEHHLLIAGK